MLKRRIIPCLDIKDGRTVKGIEFVGLKDAGDPVELAARYSAEGADELVFLDITATIENRKAFAVLVSRIAREIDIPFTVGGGISSVEDAARLVEAGADKIAVNSAAVRRPDLINEIVQEFGSQCVVVAVDSKRVDDDWIVFTHGGRKPTLHSTLKWVKDIEARGAGEILLTSMDGDGTKRGFELELLKQVTEVVNLPVIASGGAGDAGHFVQLFKNTKATAGLAASIFHYHELPILELKQNLLEKEIPVRWN